MSLARLGSITFLLAAFSLGAQAQQMQTSGALVVVPAYGEVKQANDEAHLIFMVEEQDKDRNAAASRVNRKMKDGTDIVHREDPRAILQTRGYFSYPVYDEEPAQPRSATKPRQPIGWRVGQYLEVTTTALEGLPRMVAAAQNVLALNGINFNLADASRRKLDEQLIAAAYGNLTERIAAIAKAMERKVADAVVETIDFDPSGALPGPQEAVAKALHMREAVPSQVEAPSFEPGETAIGMRVVGKIRFKRAE